MIAAFAALLPVFIVIMLGFGFRRSGLVGESHWQGVDHVCYFVLFPAIIFKEIAGTDFAGVPVLAMAAAMMMALATMFALLLLFRKHLYAALAMSGPQYSSLFQGATRWHTFIALAIIPVYFGPGALAIGAVAAAAMIPLLNVVNVAVVSVHGGQTKVDSRKLICDIARNPFVVSSVLGVVWQALGLPLPGVAAQVLDIVGKGALGLALLAVGAGLQFGNAAAARAPIAVAVALKLLAMPLFMAGWLALFGVTGQAAAVVILAGAVPTGSGAYVLARQLGGDAGMVANILTAQLIAAAVTIPMVAILL